MTTDQTDEKVDVEIVDPKPLPAIPEPNPVHRAIDDAAQFVLDNPGAPGRDEFLALATTARILSMSGAAPKAVRNNPYIAFHVALVGRDFGLSPSAALQLIDVIGDDRNPDKGYQLSLSPQLLNAQLARLKLGKIVPVERGYDRCVARAVSYDGEILGETSFDWEEAQIADLVDSRCPDAFHHWTNDKAEGRARYCKCRQGYKTFPKRMMWWRACGFAADDWFPQASLGLYSAEALGSAIDEQGRAVDPATVSLPEGYEPPPPPPPPPPADGALLWELQGRARVLPTAQKAALKDAIYQRENIRGVPFSVLRDSDYRLVLAMVKGQEAAAEASGAFDPTAAAHDLARQQAAIVTALHRLAGCHWPLNGDPLQIAQSPQEPPEPQPSAPTPPSPPAAPEPPAEQPPAKTADDIAAELRAKMAAVEHSAPAASPDMAARARETAHESIAAEVQGMRIDQVDDELRHRQVPVGRETAVQRRALLVAARYAAEQAEHRPR